LRVPFRTNRANPRWRLSRAECDEAARQRNDCGEEVTYLHATANLPLRKDVERGGWLLYPSGLTRCGLRKVQTTHRSCRRSKFIRFKTHALQHRYEQIRERIIAISIKCQMLAMFETAARKNGRQVCRNVRVGVAEIRAVNN